MIRSRRLIAHSRMLFFSKIFFKKNYKMIFSEEGKNDKFKLRNYWEFITSNVPDSKINPSQLNFKKRSKHSLYNNKISRKDRRHPHKKRNKKFKAHWDQCTDIKWHTVTQVQNLCFSIFLLHFSKQNITFKIQFNFTDILYMFIVTLYNFKKYI